MQVSRPQRFDRIVLAALSLACAFFAVPTSAPAAEVSVKQILAYKPRHFDQEYDIPTPEQVAQCKVNVIKQAKISGYEVYGPQGQLIRKFMDTNGDVHVDTWSYYHNGMEVYRDIDSNYNNKFDQARWVNTGGSRWALDTDEDGHIDGWKSISPEEVSQVVVRAIVTQDVALLSTLLVTKADLQNIGIVGETEKKILDAVGDPATHFRKIATASPGFLKPTTKWLQFNGSSPSVIPAEQLSLREDLYVYENTMAVVELGVRGAAQGNTGLVQIGEMVKVGNIWKLTTLPVPQGNNPPVLMAGLLMQGSTLAGQPNEVNVQKADPKIQQLVQELQELDQRAPQATAGAATVVEYYRARLGILDKLVKATGGNQQDQETWIRQIADFLASGIQSDAYPQGATTLKKLQAFVNKANPNSSLATHITYRLMLGEYTSQMKQANNDDRQKVQSNWLKEFEQFVNAHPRTEESADSAWQIAVINEFNGNHDVARKWYERLVSDNVQTQATERANGALRRLNLTGKPLTITGPTLQGQQLDLRRDYAKKIVLVVFWSTWCKPCTEDLPQLKALYQQYRQKGFEIVGVNLDTQSQLIPPYIQQHGVEWPSIYQEGGLESPLARQFGIISLPTMFLVDMSGNVVNRNAAVVDVKTKLVDAFKPNAGN